MLSLPTWLKKSGQHISFGLFLRFCATTTFVSLVLATLYV